ncbi:hypothetical protein Tco_0027880, partial [Tanacetum coccineum]
GRQNRGQENNARGGGAAGYGGAHNRVGNANPGQARQIKMELDEEQLLSIAGGQDNAIDEDVDEQPVQDLALSVDNVFQAHDCDAFDSDVDEALICTDIAKITRKRSKPDKHGHGKGKRIKELGECYQK